MTVYQGLRLWVYLRETELLLFNFFFFLMFPVLHFSEELAVGKAWRVFTSNYPQQLGGVY